MTSTDHRPGTDVHEDSVGALVSRASQQISRLVRDELRLAQGEMADKGKRFGIGGGLYGGAAIVAIVAFQALVATGIAALALALPVWAAALIVSGVLLALAAVLAALGRKKVRQATPPVPERAIDSVRADVTEIRERAHR
ncbi:phage holin family protein [Streptomyces sp. NBC_01803]|uniref:phage holin family protein n=1 Tax=Streptomyces sp. NBC_01803 TaxID=2975946 RepID=UPI002DD9EF7E|nr:phage holin family protein [Streptomyces sp. NBC_01803]WSA47235.1 phage holin family protein [Streptomyces sp. NBC_01803]